MTRENRAKQFAPFAALKGFEDALRLVELEAENNPGRNELLERVLNSEESETESHCGIN